MDAAELREHHAQILEHHAHVATQRQLDVSVERWEVFLKEIEKMQILEDLLTSDYEVLRALGKRLSE